MPLVEQLRAVASVGYTPRGAKCAADYMNEAADEIERLRVALEQIAMIQHVRTAEQAADYFQHVARKALRTTEQKL